MLQRMDPLRVWVPLVTMETREQEAERPPESVEGVRQGPGPVGWSLERRQWLGSVSCPLASRTLSTSLMGRRSLMWEHSLVS